MDIQNIKKQFLRKAPKILKRQEQLAKHREDVTVAQQQQFDTLSKIMLKAEDNIQMSFTEGDIGTKINDVLTAVSAGTITPSEAQKMMELIRSGFEMSEMRELMQQLTKAGLLENK